MRESGEVSAANSGEVPETSPDSLILSDVDEQLFDTGGSGQLGPELAGLPMRRWRCGCGRGRWMSWSGRSTSLGEGSALRTAIEEGKPHSAILYGPPGAGKTTLARIAAAGAEGAFEEESAVNVGQSRDPGGDRARAGAAAGVGAADDPLPRRDPSLQQGAAGRAAAGGRGRAADADRGDDREPLLRGQLGADLALAGVRAEAAGRGAGGGAAAAGAGRSRARDRRAAADRRRGAGDAGRAQRRRRPGRALRPGAGGRAGRRASAIDVAAIEDALQRKALDYDRQGDRHYDFVSAWIKATRGSDVDASLYYLAVMLEGGEDPRFIARRMVILASEDVGNADPQALLVADAAARAVDRVGLPECALNLAQACVYLALAPKSNASYKALAAARAEVRENGAKTPPDYLRDAHYPGAEKLGRGSGYRYAHDEPGGVSDQQLLPEGLAGRRFYAPTDRGFEAELGRRLAELRRDSASPSKRRNFLKTRRGLSGRLSKLEPGRADIPTGGLDWGPPVGTYTGGRGRRVGLDSAPSVFRVRSLRQWLTCLT